MYSIHACVCVCRWERERSSKHLTTGAGIRMCLWKWSDKGLWAWGMKLEFPTWPLSRFLCTNSLLMLKCGCMQHASREKDSTCKIYLCGNKTFWAKSQRHWLLHIHSKKHLVLIRNHLASVDTQPCCKKPNVFLCLFHRIVLSWSSGWQRCAVLFFLAHQLGWASHLCGFKECEGIPEICCCLEIKGNRLPPISLEN